jgi:hypothetical protein
MIKVKICLFLTNFGDLTDRARALGEIISSLELPSASAHELAAAAAEGARPRAGSWALCAGICIARRARMSRPDARCAHAAPRAIARLHQHYTSAALSGARRAPCDR